MSARVIYVFVAELAVGYTFDVFGVGRKADRVEGRERGGEEGMGREGRGERGGRSVW